MVRCLQQAGEFKTGEEDLSESPEVRLRTAYREASMAVLGCALPDPGRPILRVRAQDPHSVNGVPFI